jgi:hypothetical protein
LTPLRLQEAGVPPGVVNIVPGHGETAGAALASHDGVDRVALQNAGQRGDLQGSPLLLPVARCRSFGDVWCS